MKHPLAVLSIALLGCGHSTLDLQPAPISAPRARASSTEPNAEARAPVVVAWVENSRADTSPQSVERTYVLVARVSQPGALSMPLRVDVDVPTGVTLVRGTRHYLVQPAPPGAMHETTFELRAAAPPAQDLVLVADAQGERSGVHAEARYRFGRPEPVAIAPTRGGADIVVHGVHLGQGVTMTPESP